MKTQNLTHPTYSRSQALKSTTCGFSWLAFSALAHQEAMAAKGLSPKQPHFAARAKRVIMLNMPGGPSHVDTFDYKPQLNKDDGKPAKYGKARGATLFASPFEFKQHGESGLWISELFPHVASMADDLCLLRSMHTDVPDHVRAQLQMHTGTSQSQRPSIGVWSLYGLGSVSQNLPGYVWIDPGKASKQALSNSFLPPEFRGTGIGVAKGGAMAETKALYGIDDDVTEEFGRKCLTAVRFAEAGVRFIELGHSPGWDTHGELRTKLPEMCAATDKPIAGLLKDLKRRDMLKDTLVLWSGEFGRTPHGQGGNGRDHNAKGFTSWMAGGGVKGGFSYGSTDEYGYEAVENKMHVHDWHATILHLLGLDHEKLTYRYAGRDFRLTDVYGHVAKEILA